MKFKENVFYNDLERILESENLKFQIERKIPEMSTRADFFIYSEIPTIIEFIRISHQYYARKSSLISKLISYKLINDGYTRLILIFYVTSPRYVNVLKRLEEDQILKSISDEIIILEREILKNEDFSFSSEEVNKIKIAIKKEVRKNEIIRKMVDLNDKMYSINRIYYTLENINSFSGRDSLILSFYFNFFDNEIKKQLRDVFISNMNEWIDCFNKDNPKYRGNFYIRTPPEEEFDKHFITSGWDFNNIELQAIIFEFSRLIEKKLIIDKFPKYYFMQQPFSDIFLKNFHKIKEKLEDNKDCFKDILGSNNYNNLDKDLLIYLINYCLRNSNFKGYLPLNNLIIKKVKISYYQHFLFNNKTIIIKTLNLERRSESFFSLNHFGKYIRAIFSDNVILILFVRSISSENILGEYKNKKKKLISLEENGWRTYPFQDYENNILILNKLFEEVNTDEQ